MSEPQSPKRRSERLMFTLPVRMEGFTAQGEPFEVQGRATALNRHGAQIQVETPAPVGKIVWLTNLTNNARAEFRVVKTLEPSAPGGLDLGVEALEDVPDFWGIRFPPCAPELSESRALVECRRCRALTFLPLSLTEVDVLESGGVLAKPCEVCHTDTPWGYAKERAGAEGSTRHAEHAAPGRETSTTAERRVFVQRPVLIRTAAGQSETVQTESFATNEITCTSDKSYEVDQDLTLEWSHPSTGQKVQARGRVGRRYAIGGSRRKIYSIRYKAEPIRLPAAPLRRTWRLPAVARRALPGRDGGPRPDHVSRSREDGTHPATDQAPGAGPNGCARTPGGLLGVELPASPRAHPRPQRPQAPTRSEVRRQEMIRQSFRLPGFSVTRLA